MSNKVDLEIRNTAAGRLVGQLDVIVLQARNVGHSDKPCRPCTFFRFSSFSFFLRVFMASFSHVDPTRADCVVEFEKTEFVTREGSSNNPVWNHGASL